LPARLLVDLPNWLGDQVMGLPAVDRLVAANDRGETTIHTRPRVGRLIEQLFPVSAVVASPPKASPVMRAIGLGRPAGRFDIGVTLRHASRAKILLRLATRRAYGSCGGGAWALLDECHPVDRTRHQVHDADPMLCSLGVSGVDRRWRAELPAMLKREGERALRRAGAGDGRLVGLAPAAAGGPSKRWPAAAYRELTRQLKAVELEPVVVAGPGEEAVAAEVAADGIAIAGVDVDAAGLAGVLDRLAVLVTNDSGPMHLAAAIGTPVVALFGPTDPGRTAPLGDGHIVLSPKLDCAPCHQPRCPLGHTACLHDLPVEAVFNAVLRALA
jgi:heptosyltransferase-2